MAEWEPKPLDPRSGSFIIGEYQISKPSPSALASLGYQGSPTTNATEYRFVFVVAPQEARGVPHICPYPIFSKVGRGVPAMPFTGMIKQALIRNPDKFDFPGHRRPHWPR